MFPTSLFKYLTELTDAKIGRFWIGLRSPRLFPRIDPVARTGRCHHRGLDVGGQHACRIGPQVTRRVPGDRWEEQEQPG